MKRLLMLLTTFCLLLMTTALAETLSLIHI